MAHRRRRRAIPRPDRFVGPDAARPRAPRGGGRGAAGRARAARPSAHPARPRSSSPRRSSRRTPVEKVRLVSSGTEATMSALRLARGFTGRDMVVKFAGCYHGHVDALLAQAGSGVVTLGLPETPGRPRPCHRRHVVLPYNDRAAVEAAFAELGPRIACVITEAAAGNMGVVPPEPGFNAFLSETCRSHGALFISDEVMTGFRVTRSGHWGLDGARGLAAGPDDVRQGDGRRLPGCGVRRTRRRHGAAGTERARLPGRHVVGQSRRHHGRPHHAAAGRR